MHCKWNRTTQLWEGTHRSLLGAPHRSRVMRSFDVCFDGASCTINSRFADVWDTVTPKWRHSIIYIYICNDIWGALNKDLSRVEWRSHEWKISANHRTSDKKSLLAATHILFYFFRALTCVWSTMKYCIISSTHQLFAMCLSTAVLWRHTGMYCDVVLNDCLQNVSKGARVFSHCRCIEFHSSIIDRCYRRLACTYGTKHSN